MKKIFEIASIGAVVLLVIATALTFFFGVKHQKKIEKIKDKHEKTLEKEVKKKEKDKAAIRKLSYQIKQQEALQNTKNKKNKEAQEKMKKKLKDYQQQINELYSEIYEQERLPPGEEKYLYPLIPEDY